MSTSVKAPAKAKRKPRHIVPQACLASLNEPPRSALRWEEGSTNEATGVREFQAFASINGGEERQVAIISAEPRGKDRFFYRCEKILCFEEFDSDKMRVRSSFGIYGFNMADLDTQIGRSVKNVEIMAGNPMYVGRSVSPQSLEHLSRGPWGKIQNARALRFDQHGRPDIVTVSTAGHGGYILSEDATKEMPSPLRSGRCYEEDCGWSRVALSFPELFTPLELYTAQRTLANYEPDVWEKYFGQELAPGMSQEKDNRTFLAKHADDYLVVSAITSKDYPDFVEVTAVRGKMTGEMNRHHEAKHFYVPSEEYSAKSRREPYFVIDLDRHSEEPPCLEVKNELTEDEAPSP
ncbi:hypothetical protein WSS15_29920 [Acetobacter pasteurianus]|uniref:DUF7007 domain-containing protein n=1 Tax=Acetobacter pasteurianus NBRC 3278 TaxID=1226660 RepID=A0A401X830_ACEPA|nr:hypothetical protein [Acetobacter pasteurianus]QHM90270.1 hypothetical protein FCN51_01365 [Acetobacter pasteurianus]GCD60488.1 hypothetical protein NBRC3277_3063 [Acetobacter pasteurianus NBRC 3277]GCD64030.1 hypothetical protein NBRC3278_3123 [Acetobacter pasteurianus NBRC 3278]GCD70461.1 hypothetical protein NBRC3280_3096 [Acetobacter pasteurianus NBRC 3280]GLH30342.1 hypothetical protein WSS15_29920 [Acetobacter pasteurianus]